MRIAGWLVVVLLAVCVKGECVVCPIGYFAPQNCTKDSGEHCSIGSCPKVADCLPCPVGHYCIGGNKTLCPLGSISDMKGMSKCKECIMGFEADSNRTSCIACEPGFAKGIKGKECKKCLSGTYTPFFRSAVCYSCPPGTYQEGLGEIDCIPCGTGRYTIAEGTDLIAKCLNCPKGYYCPLAATSAPVICPAGFHCVLGSALPTSCPVFFSAEERSSSCDPSYALYLLIAIDVLMVGVLCISFCVFAILLRKCGRGNAANAQSLSLPILDRTKTDSMIPAPHSGPVYAGL